ncbi:phosphoglycerate mutase family protein [Rhodococcus oxybenzonivorans]|uniref:SixA phosphatase family protein n=1 Tax=Rhodococcus TaxID=1827 RepID=UPI00131F9291|nr:MULTISPECIES: phosphoglycerate mutase family protein [Rhodococcus]MDV7354522.1 phosphoglycerate mutase family protein [Rhodococcus oxybenzonivorans]QHE71026.1 MutT1 [Rhodococcus sp. WAY2]
MFVLVRHAHAGNKTQWHGPDAARPLSGLGRRQADHLVAALAGIEIRALLSSPTVRCRGTLAPLAAARGLTVEDHCLLAPGAPVDRLFAALCAPDIDGTLWCTHGEVLDDLAATAPTHRSARVPPATKTAKGGAWIIDPAAPPPFTFRYIAPDPT